MKKYIALLLAVLLLLAGCSDSAEDTAPTTEVQTEPTMAATEPQRKTRDQMHIWISLPEETDPYWYAAGMDLQQMLENMLYNVHLMFAISDPEEQALQLEQALDEGADCLIVAPVDSAALEQVGIRAAEEGVCVISYERLWMDTDAVDYYVSFDYEAMGKTFAEFLTENTVLSGEDPLTVEFFMGTPEDNNAMLLHRGLYESLLPWLESGKISCPSGRLAFEDACVVDMDTSAVEKALKDYMQIYYDGGMPDVIFTATDDFADACIRVLQEQGVTEYPIITGIGGSENAKEQMQMGRLAMSLILDRYVLNDKCVELADAVLSGKEPTLTHVETCHNHAKYVPAYLCGYGLMTP